MEQSLSIPVATSFRTLHVGTLEQRRAELNAALKAAGRSEKISFTHIIAFALVRAAHETARDHRVVPAQRRQTAARRSGDSPRSRRRRRSARTVRGSLVVPVIKNADTLDFAAFRAAYEDLVAKARDNKLSVEEQTGASFTLTNPGGIGTVASVPRLMVGQGAIIAAGAIAYPPGFGTPARDARAARRRKSHDDDVDLRSPRHPRCAVGRVLQARRRAARRRRRILRDVFAQLGVSAAVRGAISSANGAPCRRRARRSPQRPTAGPAVRGDAARDRRRHGDRLGLSPSRPPRRALDPLGEEPPGDPSLDPATYNLTPAMMRAIPASVLRVKVPGNTLAEVLPRLRETYSSTIAYEIEHISNTRQREWLREYIESGLHRPLTAQRRVQVLQRLTKVETMERYFRKQFMSQKTFSIEGLDVMVPMLEETISMLAEDGTQDGRARHGAPRPALDDRARRQPSVRRAAGRVRIGGGAR
jgi:2-oxoglutarate decarboxylase